MPKFELNSRDMEAVNEKLMQYGSKRAVAVVNEMLLKEAAPIIEESIHSLLPDSGRKWKGKRLASRKASPLKLFREKGGPLFVTIKTSPSYNYLYFPDDGSNTKRHFGNQQFMTRGAEAAAGSVGKMIVQELVELFET